MPLTFLAHQAPVLPVVRRWPRAIDGLTVVVGSMAPDFAYVLSKSRFALDAHALPGALFFGVPVTLAISWLIARVLAPVVPAHLPDAGDFHLRDYRGLSTHHFEIVPTLAGATLGVLSHLVVDDFTHRRGWLAQHATWWSDPVFDGGFFGRDWTPYQLAQVLGHVVGSAVTICLLWRYGRQRWFAERARPVPIGRCPGSAATLWACTLVGAAVGVVVALGIGVERTGPPWQAEASASGPLRLAATTFAGMTVGALVVRWRSARVTP